MKVNLSLTLSQTANSRPFQTETFCRRQLYIWWKWQKYPLKDRKHCGKRRNLLVTSNFSFSHCVFYRLVLQTSRNQGLFGKGLSIFQLCLKWQILECFKLQELQIVNLKLVQTYISLQTPDNIINSKHNVSYLRAPRICFCKCLFLYDTIFET